MNGMLLSQNRAWICWGQISSLLARSNEGFDFIWVMRWPSMSARDAGWEWWNSSGAQDNWAESIDGIMSYSIENVFPI